MNRLHIADLKQLTPGTTVKFNFNREGISLEGFAANVQGEIVAFENRCRHLPLPLDYGDNRFFDRDGKFFICQSHGALYEPLTGKCVRGPCQGASLTKLKVKVENGALWLLEESTD